MGNCKSCINSKTSDDVEGRSEGQGQRSSRVSLRSAKITSRDPVESHVAGTSSRSISSASKREQGLSSSSQPPISIGVDSASRGTEDQSNDPDLQRRSSSRFSHRKLSSCSTKVKASVINVRPAGGDVYDDDGRALMKELDKKYGPVRDQQTLCHILWQESEHLTFGQHYTFSRKDGLRLLIGDSFFTSHPTFYTFRQLLELYGRGASHHETAVAVEDFLEKVLETRVMKICWAFYNRQNKRHPIKREDFKNLLRSIWFRTSAFRHIFVGDEDDEVVYGQHNWLQYCIQQRNGKINYIGCCKQIERIMVAIKYNWNGSRKDFGSMFIGTSPEFELAIYTSLYFQHLLGQREKEKLFQCNFDIRELSRKENVLVKVVINLHDNTLTTAYPMKP